MRSRADLVYLALATATAVAFGVVVGSYWAADAVVLAVVSFVVISVCSGSATLLGVLTFLFQRTPTRRPPSVGAPAADPGQRAYVPRSRIAHYVVVSRIKSAVSAIQVSDNFFERELVSKPSWRTMSSEELRRMFGRRRESPVEGHP